MPTTIFYRSQLCRPNNSFTILQYLARSENKAGFRYIKREGPNCAYIYLVFLSLSQTHTHTHSFPLSICPPPALLSLENTFDGLKEGLKFKQLILLESVCHHNIGLIGRGGLKKTNIYDYRHKRNKIYIIIAIWLLTLLVFIFHLCFNDLNKV